MSISTVKVIIDRIKAATSQSPIAVFKTPDGFLDASFASTVECQRLLQMPAEDTGLIGVYDKSLCMDEIRSDLRAVNTRNPFYEKNNNQGGGHYE